MTTPQVPQMSRVRANYPGYEFVDFAELAQRTGQTVDQAASNALVAYLDSLRYVAVGTRQPEAEAMEESAGLFPQNIESDLPASLEYMSGPKSMQWSDVTVTATRDEVDYLMRRPNGEPDPTGMTFREHVRQAAVHALRVLNARQSISAVYVEPPRATKAAAPGLDSL